jgi:hypothetical protein
VPLARLAGAQAVINNLGETAKSAKPATAKVKGSKKPVREGKKMAVAKKPAAKKTAAKKAVKKPAKKAVKKPAAKKAVKKPAKKTAAKKPAAKKSAL